MGIRLGAAELFPSSNTPIFFVDLWLPYGTDIATTEKMASDIETSINGQPGVVTTIATVGQGSMRFILTYKGSGNTATTRRSWCAWTTSAVLTL
jgi:multidrug efflux pump subunit AcrB